MREQLIKTDGQPDYGLFPQGIQQINYLDYDLRTPMDKKRSQLAKRFAFNQFHFISFSSNQLLVGLAIVDLKLVSQAFLYLYEPTTGRFEEFSFLQPLANKTLIEPRPNDGESYFRKGTAEFSIKASRLPGVRQVNVSIGKKVSINATLDETTLYAPLSLCSRSGYSGWTFTQKSTARTCNGTVQWHDQTYDLKAINALAGVDWTGGYMRKETAWNWGSLSHQLDDGRLLGFNFAAGVNETGHTENALWLDGRLIKINMIEFLFDRTQPKSSWALRSNDGMIDLHFTPVGARSDKTNALLIQSNFRQFYGRYHGEIHLPQETIVLQGALGLTEDHYAKW